jgi:spore germination protein GerM
MRKKSQKTGRNSAAGKKGARGPAKKKSFLPNALLFWLAFAAVVVLLFIINLPRMRETIAATHVKERIQGLPREEDAPRAAQPETTSPSVPPPNVPPAGQGAESYPSLEEELAALGAAQTSSPEKENPPKVENEEIFQTRTLYLIKMDSAGTLLRTPVRRQVKNSTSVLFDTINALLDELTDDEKKAGEQTLIPQGTKLLGASLRGKTAFLNFNENFMFNDFGVEGYKGQLNQIIWTATEFQNIADVQFLIEGQPVEYLGDNIKISSPISRETFR